MIEKKYLNEPVLEIKPHDGKLNVKTNQRSEIYDYCIICTHPPEALKMLEICDPQTKELLCRFKFQKFFFKMQELDYVENSKVLNHKDEVISFKCELQENLQKAMKEFVEKHPNWDQYRILQAAIAGFLMQKGFQNRDLTRLYIGNMFSMNFKD